MTETTEPKEMAEILCKGFFPDFLLNDADGNMLSDSEASYIWNSDNRLVRVEKTLGDCKHDKNRKGHGYGHLKHSKESVAYEEYTYLPQDWRRITRKTGKIQSDSKKRFGCNPKSEELTYVSIYDGADESHEYLGTEPRFKFRGRCKPAKPQLKIFREFIGGPGSDDIAYTRYNRLSLAMLKDGLGSTIALTSKDGKAIARIGYDAWGEFRWNDKDCKKSPCEENEFESYLNRFGTTWGFGHANHNGWAFGKSFAKKLTPYLYTGRRYSEITNQYFNRNRYYSPALGRFISKDPIGFNGGNNLYGYVANNPLIYTDPFGLVIKVTMSPLQKMQMENGRFKAGQKVTFDWQWKGEPTPPSTDDCPPAEKRYGVIQWVNGSATNSYGPIMDTMGVPGQPGYSVKFLDTKGKWEIDKGDHKTNIPYYGKNPVLNDISPGITWSDSPGVFYPEPGKEEERKPLLPYKFNYKFVTTVVDVEEVKKIGDRWKLNSLGETAMHPPIAVDSIGWQVNFTLNSFYQPPK